MEYPTPEQESKGKVYLFNDEFTNYNESDIGIKAILLLTKLGYEVKIPVHKESGRTFLSKGLVRTSKKIATENVNLLKDIITEKTPLIGIEPSAILAFRDEYPELVDKELQPAAQKLANNALFFEEFISAEIEKGNITVRTIYQQMKNKSCCMAIASKKQLQAPNRQKRCFRCQ